MTQDDAIALIAPAVLERGGTWADLGAGEGVFTRAVASLIGPGGTVYAIDRSRSSLDELERDTPPGTARIRTVVADFTEPLTLPPLDGVIIANALHYVPYRSQPRVVAQIGSLLSANGPIVVVEYDRRSANQWVPYPISPTTLASVAHEAGFAPPAMLATWPSRYTGTIYSAIVRRAAPTPEH